MSDQKIPDKSNFLKKFATVESFLQKKTGIVEQASERINNDNPPLYDENKFDIPANKSIERSQSNSSDQLINTQAELKCSKCGVTRRPKDVFCMDCGNKHEPIPNSQTNTNESIFEPKSSPTSIPKCSNCGTPHKSGDLFCMNCGNKL